jgi:tRNA pseudouridine38-40 synthase
MRFFITLSFKGSSYCGWQIQPDQPSVQEEVERALTIFLGEKCEVTGAGRTDAGVNAINYVAHFDSNNPLPFQDIARLIYKINAILTSDIVVHNIYQVDPMAHARFDAVNRTYNYFIHTRKDPFLDQYSYYFPYPVNIDKMNEAAMYLIGEKDFTSMAKLHSDAKTNICTVTDAFWAAGSPVGVSPLSPTAFTGVTSACYGQRIDNSDTFCFTISANRFLRNMVRAIVGSLLEVGRGKHEPEWITEILQQKNRCSAGSSVPAHPLFLTKIEYPDRRLDWMRNF